MSISSTVVRLALVLLVWAASPLAAEFAYRLIGATPATEMAGLYQQMPEGNYRQRALVDADANWFVAKFAVHTDALGFRCDPDRRFGANTGDRVDALIVGDSQGFGQGVDFDKSLAGTVIAQAARDGVRVANAATGGHYLRNQYELVRLLADESQLEVRRYVVFLTPYLLGWPGDRARASVGPDGRLYGGEVTWSKQAMVEIKTRTVLYTKLRDAIRRTILPPQDDASLIKVFVEEFATGEIEQRRAETFHSFMSAFKQWASARGATIELVYTPLALEFDFDQIRRAAAATGATIDPESPFRVATAVARQLDIPLHDLRPALKPFHDRGEALTLNGDPHYNGTVSVAAGAYAWTLLQPSMTSHRTMAAHSESSE